VAYNAYQTPKQLCTIISSRLLSTQLTWEKAYALRMMVRVCESIACLNWDVLLSADDLGQVFATSE